MKLMVLFWNHVYVLTVQAAAPVRYFSIPRLPSIRDYTDGQGGSDYRERAEPSGKYEHLGRAERPVGGRLARSSEQDPVSAHLRARLPTSTATAPCFI